VPFFLSLKRRVIILIAVWNTLNSVCVWEREMFEQEVLWPHLHFPMDKSVCNPRVHDHHVNLLHAFFLGNSHIYCWNGRIIIEKCICVCLTNGWWKGKMNVLDKEAKTENTVREVFCAKEYGVLYGVRKCWSLPAYINERLAWTWLVNRREFMTCDFYAESCLHSIHTHTYTQEKLSFEMNV